MSKSRSQAASFFEKLTSRTQNRPEFPKLLLNIIIIIIIIIMMMMMMIEHVSQDLVCFPPLDCYVFEASLKYLCLSFLFFFPYDVSSFSEEIQRQEIRECLKHKFTPYKINNRG